MTQLRREDYKAVKRMDKQQMTAYLQRVFRRGYEAGVRAGATRADKAEPSPPVQEAHKT